MMCVDNRYVKRVWLWISQDSKKLSFAMIVHWHTGFTCSGLSCSRLGLLTALLLHVEKSTQWWCGSISSCANVPGKELARKSCPKSTMASVKAVAATVVEVLPAAASS